MQLNLAYRCAQRDTQRASAAAKVEHDGPRRSERSGLMDEKFGATSGHEDVSIHSYPKAAELHPTKDVFEWKPGHSFVEHSCQFDRSSGGREEKSGFVFSEYAACGSKPGNDS
nr:hypothetical protein BJQ95_01100 [Cryobacterium sp. SO1]